MALLKEGNMGHNKSNEKVLDKIVIVEGFKGLSMIEDLFSVNKIKT